MSVDSLRASRPRAREAGIALAGDHVPGACNAITDVPDVRVGHVTRWEGEGPSALRTGVTAILPHGGNLFREKVTAAVHTINGFGKPTGWAQVGELGVVETPIVLTNTLSVGEAFTGVVRHALAENPDIGGVAGTVNPLVAECNDGDLSAIRQLAVTSDDVLLAIRDAQAGPVAEGAVGAGTGMTCYGWKGGIGTASRIVELREGRFTIGALVLANFGRPDDLTVAGSRVGDRLPRTHALAPGSEVGGSIVCVLATDLPFDGRQLGRLARRAQNGIARTGGDCEHGSGEFVIAFSTTHGRSEASALPADSPQLMNPCFRAVASAVEESILNALFTAVTVTGVHDRVVTALPAELVVGLTGQGGAGSDGA
jgi:D-aminopeptidase